MPERELTPKELNVVDTFEQTRPGTGSDRKSNILNPNSGWREIIADMPESEIVCGKDKLQQRFYVSPHWT
jgi:hypothetical protein